MLCFSIDTSTFRAVSVRFRCNFSAASVRLLCCRTSIQPVVTVIQQKQLHPALYRLLCTKHFIRLTFSSNNFISILNGSAHINGKTSRNFMIIIFLAKFILNHSKTKQSNAKTDSLNVRPRQRNVTLCSIE